MKAKYLVIIFFIFLLLSPSTVFCAVSAKVTTNVTAEKMVYDSVGKKVTFSGKVKVMHPDFTLNSDRLDLFLAQSDVSRPTGGDGLNTGVLRIIVAESNVAVTLADGRLATCNKVTYTAANEIMTMEGNPVLREGANQVRGDKMIFYLRENRNEVQGRVTVDFVSGGDAESAPDSATGGEAGDNSGGVTGGE